MNQTQEDLLRQYTLPATAYKLAAAASNNLTSLKATGGVVLGVQAANINAAARYLKLYNKAIAPVVASDVPVLVVAIPGNASGAGNNISIPQAGINFPAGIAFAIVTGIGDTDNTSPGAGEVVVNIQYR